jgi:hypothetical protein
MAVSAAAELESLPREARVAAAQVRWSSRCIARGCGDAPQPTVAARRHLPGSAACLPAAAALARLGCCGSRCSLADGRPARAIPCSQLCWDPQKGRLVPKTPCLQLCGHLVPGIPRLQLCDLRVGGRAARVVHHLLRGRARTGSGHRTMRRRWLQCLLGVLLMLGQRCQAESHCPWHAHHPQSCLQQVLSESRKLEACKAGDEPSEAKHSAPRIARACFCCGQHSGR